MTVSDILNAAGDLIQSASLFEELSSSTLPASKTSDSRILVNCLNVVLNDISSNYFEIKKVYVNNFTNKLNLKNILGDFELKDIIAVYDLTGAEICYSISDGYLITDRIGFRLEYTVFPLTIKTKTDSIDFWENKNLKSFIIAQGVVAEYYLIKGCFEESQIWEQKFRQSMHSIVQPRKEIKMPARRWN